MPEPWSTPESTCHAWTPALGLLEALEDSCPLRADFLRIPDLGEQLHGCFPDAGLWRSGHSLPKEQPQRCSDRLRLAVRLC
jgi:hypothetical protein